MNKCKWLLVAPFCLAMLLFFAVAIRPTRAQLNPTPIVITLTPQGSLTAVPNPTSDDVFQPDRFEPNDEPGMATPIGWQTEVGLTLDGVDVDYFTGYLKSGQWVHLGTTVDGRLDTRLKLFWNGQLMAENDDRSPTDLGSAVTWAAAADGWFVAMVEKATAAGGTYDLEVALVEPTVTPPASQTALPTATPPPRPSPTPLVPPDLAEPNDTLDTARPLTPGVRSTYTLGPDDVDTFRFIAKAGNTYRCETVTSQVDTLLTVSAAEGTIGVNDDRGVGRVDSQLAWTTTTEQAIIVQVEARGGGLGQYELVCQGVVTPTPPAPVSLATISAAITPVTTTNALTVTGSVYWTVRYIDRVPLAAEPATTHVRLLVYYDANNDRSPGPGEGVANVSVLAVDAQGQRLARVFSNAQGEAIFSLSNEGVARIVVPFVPGWSARIRAGEINEGIVLGLPAVRLPVFLPVSNRPAGEE